MITVFDHECTLAVQYVTQTHQEKTRWQTDDRQQIESVAGGCAALKNIFDMRYLF